MTQARWKELMGDTDPVITREEWKLGWHFCDEWDGLLVGPGMGEVLHCHCEFADAEVTQVVAALKVQAEAELAKDPLTVEAVDL